MPGRGSNSSNDDDNVIYSFIIGKKEIMKLDTLEAKIVRNISQQLMCYCMMII